MTARAPDPDGIPNRAAYLAAVEQTFVTLRGRGFMLSPTDVLMVDGWREAGVPARVVVDAVTRGIQRFRKTHPPSDPVPSTLAYFQLLVDASVVRWRERTMTWSPHEAGATAAGTTEGHETRLTMAVRAAHEASEDDRARELLDEVLQEALTSDEDPWALAERLDRHLVERARALLNAGELAAAKDAAAHAVAAQGGARMSPAARGEREADALDRRLREHLGLPGLMEVLLGG